MQIYKATVLDADSTPLLAIDVLLLDALSRVHGYATLAAGHKLTTSGRYRMLFANGHAADTIVLSVSNNYREKTESVLYRRSCGILLVEAPE